MLAPLGSDSHAATQPRYLQETTRQGDYFVFPLSEKLTAPWPPLAGAADNLQTGTAQDKVTLGLQVEDP